MIKVGEKQRKDRDQLESELEAARSRISSLEKELEETQQGLNALSLELEERVEERTRELERVREDFRGLVKNASEGIFRISPDGKRFIFSNQALVEMLGYDDVDDLIKNISDIPEELTAKPQRFRQLLDGSEVKESIDGAELSVLRKDGSRIWLRVSLRAVIQADNLIYYEGIAQNITSDREHRERLIALHENLDLLQEAESEIDAYEAAMISAREVLKFNNAMIYKLNEGSLSPIATTDKLETSTFNVLGIESSIAGNTLKDGKTLSGNLSSFEFEESQFRKYRYFISTPVGELAVLQAFSSRTKSFNEDDVRLAELLARHLNQEIQRIHLENKLNELARRDSLTGLYNRYYFEEALEKEIERSKRYEHPLTFLMIDINGFKAINDEHGHQIGDRVLKKTAGILQENIRDADTVCRYGGDEFLIMMPETGDGANLVAERFKERLKDWSRKFPILDDPLTLATGKSYWYPDGDEEIGEVIARADERMYRDKRSKKA